MSAFIKFLPARQSFFHALSTITRLIEKDGKYALFFTGGEAVETEIILKGTPLQVELDAEVNVLLDKIFDWGIEHHYSLIYADIRGI